MSRTDEVHRITENVYKSIMEQFNPCLRNFIAMGKSYEKALTSVTSAAKGYFDALVRMGEMANHSQGSKDLEEAAWEVLFQMAEVHRQIQIQLEEMLKSFHNELLTELEKKVELDARYLNAALKKYQMEHKSKGESLDKCQAELKKLRRKSQGSKHSSKYGDKEMQYVEAIGNTICDNPCSPQYVEAIGNTICDNPCSPQYVEAISNTICDNPCSPQYVEAISNKQSELDNYITDGYKNALSEERRRFCFLVDRQCTMSKSSNTYHSKGKELLSQKIPMWQQVCVEPNKLPERSMFLTQPMSSSVGVAMSESKPPDSAFRTSRGLMSQQRLTAGVDTVNGSDGAHAQDDYQQWVEGKKVSPQMQRHGDVHSNTLPVRKAPPTKSKSTQMETRTLPRSSSMAAGLEKNGGRTRVQAVFSHTAGDNGTLLSFSEGDTITLLVPEARDGWHYGENEKSRMRGWFPFSYTRLINDSDADSMRQLRVHNLHHGKSSSTGNLLERDDVALPFPDYVVNSGVAVAALHSRQQQPYSAALPRFSQGGEEYEARFSTSSTDGKLISTV
uniref:brain-specific angiogenesis inhibitor 1-associated protein 2 isoform X2 n=1 Tax=Solea senegalensis TaxID=28829 RepID=UPI001CD8DF1C|nr:brain-specific angiogenesis inhibitor 1-associated protein 2 isoform X2 [Solea senegalensis]